MRFSCLSLVALLSFFLTFHLRFLSNLFFVFFILYGIFTLSFFIIYGFFLFFLNLDFALLLLFQNALLVLLCNLVRQVIQCFELLPIPYFQTFRFHALQLIVLQFNKICQFSVKNILANKMMAWCLNKISSCCFRSLILRLWLWFWLFGWFFHLFFDLFFNFLIDFEQFIDFEQHYQWPSPFFWLSHILIVELIELLFSFSLCHVVSKRSISIIENLRAQIILQHIVIESFIIPPLCFHRTKKYQILRRLCNSYIQLFIASLTLQLPQSHVKVSEGSFMILTFACNLIRYFKLLNI